MASKPKGLFVLHAESLDCIYGPEVEAEIRSMVEIVGPVRSRNEVRADPALLAEVELILSGWGGPQLNAALLTAAPDLKIVFYGAGSVREVMTPAAWQRDIRITSAYAVNAIPVAEFSVAQIVFCLKLGWHHVMETRSARRWERLPQMPGAYGSTVGIVGLGQIGQRVCRMLADYDVRVIAYDPYCSADTARALSVQLVELETVFATSDVVSIHAPLLPETHQMIAARQIQSMKPQASLINTANGGLIDESALIDVLRRRGDLVAVLDVTDPEPPAPNSTLWDLPNVVLLPHIAGSMDRECLRMGRFMVGELRRYLAGEPLECELNQDQASRLA